jgi:hypothetical protein
MYELMVIFTFDRGSRAVTNKLTTLQKSNIKTERKKTRRNEEIEVERRREGGRENAKITSAIIITSLYFPFIFIIIEAHTIYKIK